MTHSVARRMNPLRLVRALRARPRLLGAALAGVLVYVFGRGVLAESAAAMTLVAWNSGASLYLLLAWHGMSRSGVQGIRDRAVTQDEGRIAILALVVLAALAVLLAAGTQLALVKDLHG